ncbi:MAG: site-2 protease family protein [Deltaproteobacteria bacterium]|jgi:Zn-dependent protease
MFGSLKVASIKGIPIRLHFSLLVIAVLLVVQFGWFGIPAGFLLFGSLLLHELGHALTAQRYGIPIAAINLNVLGGMALMKRPADTPKQEMVIAAAGPAVSFVLGLFFVALTVLTGASLSPTPTALDLIAYGAVVNVMMGLFNLLPALPMDGGRIFRAGLSLRFGALKATNIAAWVSRVFAVIFIGLGLFIQAWSLMLIGFVLFVLVANEQRIARVQESLRRQGPFAPSPYGPVIDVGDGPSSSVTREEFVDAHGRRFVVVTRLM